VKASSRKASALTTIKTFDGIEFVMEKAIAKIIEQIGQRLGIEKGLRETDLRLTNEYAEWRRSNARPTICAVSGINLGPSACLGKTNSETCVDS
jgi:hypothetical protein